MPSCKRSLPSVGTGWPDAQEPGVPARALDDGYHWLRSPRTGETTLRLWSPDLWCWVVTHHGNVLPPLFMASFDYSGPLDEPASRPPPFC